MKGPVLRSFCLQAMIRKQIHNTSYQMTKNNPTQKQENAGDQDMTVVLNREQHLKNVLLGIRNVNQLIAHERDQKTLIEETCKTLQNTLGYYNVWIALLDNQHNLTDFASSGLEGRSKALVQQLQAGSYPTCMQEAMADTRMVVKDSPPDDCPDCPLSGKYQNRSGLCSAISYQGALYGVIVVSAPQEYAQLEEGNELFKELANDLGFGLYTIEADRKRRKTERMLEERLKEMKCLTNISQAMYTPMSARDFFSYVIEQTEQNMRYPDSAKTRIVVHDVAYPGNRSVPADRPAISSDILIDEKPLGHISIFYDNTDADFDDQEQQLLDNVSHLLGLWIQREQTLEALEQSRENLYITLQSIGDGMIAVDIDENIVRMNPVAEKLTGYKLSEVLGKPLPEVLKIYCGDSGEETEDPAKKALETEQTVFMGNNTILVDKDGQKHQIADSAAPIKNRNKEVVGAVVVFRDVTEQYRQREVLRQSEEKYRALFENASDAILILSNGRFVDCNSEAERLFQRPCQEIIGKQPHELSPDIQPDGTDSKSAANRHIGEAAKGYGTFEWLHNMKDGTPVYTEVNLSPVEIEGEEVFLSIVRDLTERKQHELAQQVIYSIASASLITRDLETFFRKIKEELSRLIDTTNFYLALYEEETGMLSIPYEKDEKDNIEEWPVAGSMTGHVINKQTSLLLTRSEINKLIDEGSIEQIGSLCEVWMGVPLVTEGKTIGAIVVQSYDDPNAYTHKGLKLLEFVASQVSNAIGLQHYVKALNEAKLEAQKSDRLKTAFLNNLSHEIRTPLNAILGFSEILHEGQVEEERTKHLTGIIFQSGTQLLSIIEDIINISSIETGAVEKQEKQVNLEQLMSSIYYQLERQAEAKGLKFRYILMVKEEEADIVTDPTKLTQIITNMVENAIKFTDEGHVEFGCRLKDDKLLFNVADTGWGIPNHEQDSVFDRFKQGKDQPSRDAAGVGLGLSISRAFVELLGGEIWFESEPGQGSIFFFTIPWKPASGNK